VAVVVKMDIRGVAMGSTSHVTCRNSFLLNLGGIQHTMSPMILYKAKKYGIASFSRPEPPSIGKSMGLLCSRVKASNGPLGEDSGNDDIDALARKLSQEAERMRSLGESPGMEEDTSSSSLVQDDEEWLSVLSRFDHKRVGTFDPIEFELLQQLGKISIQQQTAGSSFLAPSEKVSRTAIVAFLAQYFSGMPFEDPVVIFLKEYLPGSQMIACKEMVALYHLCDGIPPADRRWKVASAFPTKDDIPVVRLLGYFVAGPSGRGGDENTDVQQANTVWVVQKWDGSVPLSMYPETQQTSGYGLGRLFGAEQAAMRNRKSMICSIVKGMLKAVSYCHERSVAHGSLGSGTFLLSTCNDRDWSSLVVKVDSFGFASFGRSIERFGVEDSNSFDAAIKADRRQLAVIVLECILSSLEEGGPSELSSAASIERVLIDVYSWDVPSYRQYVEEENRWSDAVEFMDDSLWDVLSLLASGSMDVQNILKHSFFDIDE
jgi:serine/threonine protein kinase